mmetsp:Transcript_34750/g.98022  ORF Transcript_34750/g.98022 Transcript_34750/m.98022 type:complete len:500 (+) Transcript_34750:142-1641(+)|eukprot:CAMPEP_0119151310 /NCGR_PEP_ID=MMETSP1310-20130426/46147_1 /TAXON_ID=464262 /ORGANISM="Genus nov. species nov., Strain RCC2339" /LENGTH=499 /DNA_ID=CAMNT_0007143577 /DNA_START=45 /DNA_END=1547 /DNA_ORIENTATION=+
MDTFVSGILEDIIQSVEETRCGWDGMRKFLDHLRATGSQKPVLEGWFDYDQRDDFYTGMIRQWKSSVPVESASNNPFFSNTPDCPEVYFVRPLAQRRNIACGYYCLFYITCILWACFTSKAKGPEQGLCALEHISRRGVFWRFVRYCKQILHEEATRLAVGGGEYAYLWSEESINSNVMERSYMNFLLRQFSLHEVFGLLENAADTKKDHCSFSVIPASDQTVAMLSEMGINTLRYTHVRKSLFLGLQNIFAGICENRDIFQFLVCGQVHHWNTTLVLKSGGKTHIILLESYLDTILNYHSSQDVEVFVDDYCKDIKPKPYQRPQQPNEDLYTTVYGTLQTLSLVQYLISHPDVLVGKVLLEQNVCGLVELFLNMLRPLTEEDKNRWTNRMVWRGQYHKGVDAAVLSELCSLETHESDMDLAMRLIVWQENYFPSVVLVERLVESIQSAPAEWSSASLKTLAEAWCTSMSAIVERNNLSEISPATGHVVEAFLALPNAV